MAQLEVDKILPASYISVPEIVDAATAGDQLELLKGRTAWEYFMSTGFNSSSFIALKAQMTMYLLKSLGGQACMIKEETSMVRL